MKANTPEKIFLEKEKETDRIHHLWSRTPVVSSSYEHIEYTRTDTFVEKALKFIKTNVDRIVNNQHGVCMSCMDVEFRKYMEGE